MRSAICTTAGHAPPTQVVENAGRRTGPCGRCGTSLVDRQGTWQPAPQAGRAVSTVAQGCTATDVRPPRPLVLEERRVRFDRRRPDAPAFGGLDRRRGERRAAILFDKEGVRVTRDCIEFRDRRLSVGAVRSLHLEDLAGALSLTWLPYFILAALAAVQAQRGGAAALWAIAGALALFGLLAWQRRRGPTVYRVSCSCGAEEQVVAELTSGADARLLHDAIAAAMPA